MDKVGLSLEAGGQVPLWLHGSDIGSSQLPSSGMEVSLNPFPRRVELELTFLPPLPPFPPPRTSSFVRPPSLALPYHLIQSLADLSFPLFSLLLPTSHRPRLPTHSRIRRPRFRSQPQRGRRWAWGNLVEPLKTQPTTLSLPFFAVSLSYFVRSRLRLTFFVWFARPCCFCSCSFVVSFHYSFLVVCLCVYLRCSSLFSPCSGERLSIGATRRG